MMAIKFIQTRQWVALALVLTMIGIGLVPVPTYADHKKYFKEGLRFEENKQWDKAAEKFALAVAEKPSNVEYPLHFHRCLVNAGIMLVERGDMLAEQKDYNAAFQAFRQAYSFDPTNDLARIKMRRMLELQGLPTNGVPSGRDEAGPPLKPSANIRAGFSVDGVAQPSFNKVQLPGFQPTKKQVKTDVIARTDTLLLPFIENLAQAMGLNVVFDFQVAQTRNQKLVIELRNVTRAKALEIILKANNLMYIQIDTRTLMIAMDTRSRERSNDMAARTLSSRTRTSPMRNATARRFKPVHNP
jgi:general secretion pathway protein D